MREWAEQPCHGKVQVLLQNPGLITILSPFTAEGGGHELHPVNGFPALYQALFQALDIQHWIK